MKKKTLWISILFIILLACLIKISFSKPKEKDKSSKEEAIKKVNGFVVKPTLLINEIAVSGSLLAFEEVELINEVAGRVVKIHLPEGKFVRKGTLLVKLFDDDLQAGLRKFQSQLDIQKQIQQRQSELLKVNGISQNDYEATGLQVNSLKADIEVQKAQIRKTEILAPFDGVIGLRNISVGAIVSSSTLVATIRSENNLKLDFYIPEKYGPVIRNGMKVKFALSGSDKQYDATILATERGISEDTRNLKARAVVNSKSDDLIPGAFSNVILRLSENKAALVIPTQAIIPQEMDKKVILAKNGKAHFVSVKTGIRKASGIEITQGIQPGDTIITNGILFLKEGSRIMYSQVSNTL